MPAPRLRSRVFGLSAVLLLLLGGALGAVVLRPLGSMAHEDQRPGSPLSLLMSQLYGTAPWPSTDDDGGSWNPFLASARSLRPLGPWEALEAAASHYGAQPEAQTARLAALMSAAPRLEILLESWALELGIPIGASELDEALGRLHAMPPYVQDALRLILVAAREISIRGGAQLARPSDVPDADPADDLLLLAAAIEQALPTLRAWSAVLSEPANEGPAAALEGARSLIRVTADEPASPWPLEEPRLSLAGLLPHRRVPPPLLGALERLLSALLVSADAPRRASGFLEELRQDLPTLEGWALLLRMTPRALRDLGTDPPHLAAVLEALQSQSSRPVSTRDAIRIAAAMDGLDPEPLRVAPSGRLYNALMVHYSDHGIVPDEDQRRAILESEDRLPAALRDSLTLLLDAQHAAKTALVQRASPSRTEIAVLESESFVVPRLLAAASLTDLDVQYLRLLAAAKEHAGRAALYSIALTLAEAAEQAQALVAEVVIPPREPSAADRMLAFLAPLWPPSAQAQGSSLPADPCGELDTPLSDRGNDVCFVDPFGMVVLSGTGRTFFDDRYQDRQALQTLTLDLGGPDSYFNNAGGSGPSGLLTTAAVDLGGEDTYENRKVDCVQGCGRGGGFGFLFDAAGDDTYAANELAMGAASGFSGALFADLGGDNRFEVREAALGFSDSLGLGIALLGPGSDAIKLDGRGLAYAHGAALFLDPAGDERYEATSSGFGASRSLGAPALFLDLGGDDEYIPDEAGGVDLTQGTLDVLAVTILDRRRDDSAWHDASASSVDGTNLNVFLQPGYGIDVDPAARDSDGDGFLDVAENALASDPRDPDRIPSGEILGAGNGAADGDRDGVLDLIEARLGSSPEDPDDRPLAFPDAAPPPAALSCPGGGVPGATVAQQSVGPFCLPAPADMLLDLPGILALGDTVATLFTKEYALALDLGGDDEWLNHAGSATGLQGLTPTGVAVDLGGHDVYLCAGCSNAQGGAGAEHALAMLLDLGGDDRYVAGSRSQASCSAQPTSQAPQSASLGMLLDAAGDDEYEASGESQAFIRGRGCTALLIDHAGNDTYSSPQQASLVGLRLQSQPNVAMLLDREGDDVYRFQRVPASFDPPPVNVGEADLLVFADLGGSDAYVRTAGAAEALNDVTQSRIVNGITSLFVDGRFEAADNPATGRPRILDAAFGIEGDPEPVGSFDDASGTFIRLGRAANTPIGLLDIGSTAASLHEGVFLVSIDFGGEDAWRSNAGGTTLLQELIVRPSAGGPLSQLVSLPVAVAIDLGDDNDSYSATRLAQGAGLMGVGALVDEAGDDTYSADELAQGAAWAGAALFADLEGDDRYEAHRWSMGAALQAGLSVFVDESGADDYRISDIGLGASSGHLPHMPRLAFDANAGAPLALFLDGSGDDRYRGRSLVLGAASERGSALFVDAAGNDRYLARNDSIGAAVLPSGSTTAAGFVDLAGSDTYRADRNALGANRNLAPLDDVMGAVFLDVSGTDAYLAAHESFGHPKRAHIFGIRSPQSNAETPIHELTNVAVFVDGADRDLYHSLDTAAGNNRNWSQGEDPVPRPSGYPGRGIGVGIDANVSTGAVAAQCPTSCPQRIEAAYADGQAFADATLATPTTLLARVVFSGPAPGAAEATVVDRLQLIDERPEGDVLLADAGPHPTPDASGRYRLLVDPASWQPTEPHLLRVEALLRPDVSGAPAMTVEDLRGLAQSVSPAPFAAVVGEQWMGLAGVAGASGPVLAFGIDEESTLTYQVRDGDRLRDTGILRSTGWHVVEVVDAPIPSVRLDGVPLDVSGVAPIEARRVFLASEGPTTRGGLVFDGLTVVGDLGTLLLEQPFLTPASIAAWGKEANPSTLQATFLEHSLVGDGAIQLGLPDPSSYLRLVSPDFPRQERTVARFGFHDRLVDTYQMAADGARIPFVQVFSPQATRVDVPVQLVEDGMGPDIREPGIRIGINAREPITLEAQVIDSSGASLAPGFGTPINVASEFDALWAGDAGGATLSGGEYHLAFAEVGRPTRRAATSIVIDDEPPLAGLFVPDLTPLSSIPARLQASDGSGSLAGVFFFSCTGSKESCSEDVADWFPAISFRRAGLPALGEEFMLPVQGAWPDGGVAHTFAVTVDAAGNADLPGAHLGLQHAARSLIQRWAIGDPDALDRIQSIRRDSTAPDVGCLVIEVDGVAFACPTQGRTPVVFLGPGRHVRLRLGTTVAVPINPVVHAEVSFSPVATGGGNAQGFSRTLSPCPAGQAVTWCTEWDTDSALDPEATYDLTAVVRTGTATRTSTAGRTVVVDRTAPLLAPVLPIAYPDGRSAALVGDAIPVAVRVTEERGFLARGQPPLDGNVTVETAAVSSVPRVNLTFDPASGSYRGVIPADRNAPNGCYGLPMRASDLSGNLRTGVPLTLCLVTVPTAILGAAVSFPNATSARIRFGTSEPIEGGVVEASRDTGSAPTTYEFSRPIGPADPEGFEAVLEGLEPATAYVLRIRIVNENGIPSISPLLFASTPQGLLAEIARPPPLSSLAGVVEVMANVVNPSGGPVDLLLQASRDDGASWDELGRLRSALVQPRLSFDSRTFPDAPRLLLRLTAQRAHERSIHSTGPFIVDNQAPRVKAIEPAEGDRTGPAPPVIRVATDEPTSRLNISRTSIRLDGLVIPIEVRDGHLEAPSPALASGPHRILFEAFDLSGNSVRREWVFHHDARAPEAQAGSLVLEGPEGEGVARPGSSLRASVRLLESDAETVAARVPSLGIEEWVAAARVAGSTMFSWRLEVPSDAPGGPHPVELRLLDGRGNQRTQWAGEVVVDAEPPRLEILEATGTRPGIMRLVARASEPVTFAVSYPEASLPFLSVVEPATELDRLLSDPSLQGTTTIVVSARDASGAVTATRLALELPSSPLPAALEGGPKVVKLRPGFVELAWTHEAASSFRLLRAEGAAPLEARAVVATGRFADSSVEEGREYRYAAIPLGRDGEPGPMGPIISVRVPAIPHLRSPGAQPELGPASEPFRFWVAYRHAGGLLPSSIQLRLGEAVEPLVLKGGPSGCRESCLFEASVFLPPSVPGHAPPRFHVEAVVDGRLVRSPAEHALPGPLVAPAIAAFTEDAAPLPAYSLLGTLAALFVAARRGGR